MGNMLASGLRGAGFPSGCNFVFFYISVLGLGFTIRVSVVV